MTPAIAAQRRVRKKDTEAEPPPWAYVSLLYGDEFLLGLRVRCIRGILTMLVY
jgi:hypothetical protein